MKYYLTVPLLSYTIPIAFITLVLEEGIDVSACDLVIRFHAVITLIQYIQSRGRARKEGSRFIVLADHDEENRARTMETQEKVMSLVLKEHADRFNVPCQRTLELYSQLEEKSIEGLIKLKESLPEVYLQSDAVVEFYICTETMLDEEQVEEELHGCLQEHGFDVERIIIQRDRARQISDSMFGWNDLKVLVQLGGDEDEFIYPSLQNFFLKWRFQITTSNCPVFAKLNLREPLKLDSSSPWQLKSIGSGVFKDRQSFDLKYSIDMHMKLSFSLEGKYVRIEFEEGEFVFELTLSLIRTASLGFALASWEKNSSFLFIPIENMPVLKNMLKKDPQCKTTRVTCHPLLTNLSKYPVLCIQYNLNSLEDWLNLREIYGDSYIFPLPVFDSKIRLYTENNQLLHNQAEEDIDLDLCINPIEKSLLEDAQEQIECRIPIPKDYARKKELLEDEWEVLIKSTDFTMHPMIDESNKWIELIRTSYLADNILLAKQISAAIRLANRKGKTYWVSFDDLVNAELERIQSIDTSGDLVDIEKPTVAKNQFSVLRMVVTPTRHYYPPSVPMATSRLSRMLSDKYGLIIVSFRDENLDKSENNASIHRRVKNCWINGIEFCGRTMYPLCSSASQLREHRGFFINAENWEEVLAVRKLIIPNPGDFKSSAKYLSRLGLFGTSDRPAGNLTADKLEEIEDLMAEDGTLVTDGAGYIKESLAGKLFVSSEIVGRPSAFQFRYAGLKGVLVVLPDNHSIFHGKQAPILYRKSQEKFKSDHTEMGIVKEAKAHNVYLNRESITLLESMYLNNEGVKNIWNFPSSLLTNQDKFLEETSQILEDRENAESEMTKYIHPDVIRKMALSGFDMVKEPFFFRLLRCAHKIVVSDLCRRSNLHVKKGCLAMGIPDYSDKLQTDQIFIQICKEGESPEVITGPVIMYRNPCLHPGDIRKVEAVDIPELHFSKNVLILPGSNSKYSLSASCSGGDLDGDQFSVIWDKQYIPPSTVCQNPLDYENLGGHPKKESDDATSAEALADFFVDCMENDTLGRVAHMHLALSDIRDKGAMDPICKKLAESQAVAVDFPKTGIRPDVPDEGMKIVRREGYPDFMEKKGDSYISKKVLGELYRTCKSFLFTYDLDEADKRKIPFDKSLDLDISEDLKKDAENVYKHYIIEMRRLMNQFSLRQEEEVILGRAVSWHPLLNTDRDKSSQYLTDAYSALKERFLKIFKDMCRGRRYNLDEWASAWYRVAYDQNIEFKDRPFLSFPWIAYEWLCQIKQNTFSLPELTNRFIDRELGITSMEMLHKETDSDKFTVDLLKRKLGQKKVIFDLIEQKFKDKCGEGMFELKVYGSTSILLCEEDSDLDICVRTLPKANESTPTEVLRLDSVSKDRHFLRNYVIHAADDIFMEKFDLINNDVPLIKGVMQNQEKVDISCNECGLLKTKYILALYDHDPSYFVAFWILIRWARFSGLIKFAGLEIDEPLIETATFYALVIKLLETASIDISQPKNDLEKLELPQLLDHIKQDLSSKMQEDDEKFHIQVGRLVHKFFRNAHSLDEDGQDLELIWPDSGLESAFIAQNKVSVIKKLCSRGMHMILFSRDVRELINNAKDCTSTATVTVKKLSLSLSNALRAGIKFHERNFISQTKAKVTITEEVGDVRLVFRAEGPRRAIADALNELAVLNHNNKAFTVGIPPKKASRYFMSGSTFMTVRNASNFNCKVGFEDCRGNYQPPHKTHQRSSPVLKYSEALEPDVWLEGKCIQELESTVTSQMNIFPLENKNLLKSLEITSRFGTAYVLDIEDRLPKTQITINMEDLIANCEKGKCMRKQVERKDFPKVRKTPEKNADMKMTTLKPVKGRRILEASQKGKLKADGNKRSGVAISFLPGILNPNRQKISTQLEDTEQLFKKTLTDLGYEDGKTELQRLSTSSYWIFNITASTGNPLIKFIKIKNKYVFVLHLDLGLL